MGRGSTGDGHSSYGGRRNERYVSGLFGSNDLGHVVIDSGSVRVSGSVLDKKGDQRWIHAETENLI